MAIKTITPQQAFAALRRSELRLIDIRQSYEWLTGIAEGAETIEQSQFEQQSESALSKKPIALICQRGIRSAELGERIADRNHDIFSVAGGMQAWNAADLPLHWPESELNRTERERYLRHLALPQLGLEGQLKLRQSKVLLVGAGGLGSPAALYLAAAGVGQIGIVDDDVVELSNLQRQILHSSHQIGQPKVESAKARLADLNDQISVKPFPVRIDDSNVDTLLSDFDVIIDGSDNFPTRYRVNDACIRLKKPLVYGAVQQFSGQVSLFKPGQISADGQPSPCYHCLFPDALNAPDAPNCAEAGVLGIVPGVIGCLQATEAIKYLLGVGQPLIGRLLMFDALAMSFREVRILKDPKCRHCG